MWTFLAWLETGGCAVAPVHIAASGTGHDFTTGHDGMCSTSGIDGASNGHCGQGNDEFTHGVPLYFFAVLALLRKASAVGAPLVPGALIRSTFLAPDSFWRSMR